LEPLFYFEHGCKFVKCLEEKEEKVCPRIDKEAIIARCQHEGGFIIDDYDEMGCLVLRCKERGYCQEEIPREAVEHCEEEGGEIVSRVDNRGCISYFKCVTRGEEEKSYVKPVVEVPSSTKLLQVALALERLKVELDKLVRNTNGIADYYASVGSPEERKFRTVAGMFKGVIERVEAIKDRIRNNIDTLTTRDMEEIKHDINYIKDVVLKDIVYVMLSSGEDFTSDPSEGECTTEQCFERAVRICEPARYYPEGTDGIMIDILGVEGEACILEIEKPDVPTELADELGVTPPYTMTCELTDYAFGLREKSELLEHCEGNLVSVFEAMEEAETQEPVSEEEEVI
jgi:hypothetical protein